MSLLPADIMAHVSTLDGDADAVCAMIRRIRSHPLVTGDADLLAMVMRLQGDAAVMRSAATKLKTCMAVAKNSGLEEPVCAEHQAPVLAACRAADGRRSACPTGQMAAANDHTFDDDGS